MFLSQFVEEARSLKTYEELPFNIRVNNVNSILDNEKTHDDFLDFEGKSSNPKFT